MPPSDELPSTLVIWQKKHAMHRKDSDPEAQSRENADLLRLQCPRVQEYAHNRKREPNCSECNAQRMDTTQHMR